MKDIPLDSAYLQWANAIEVVSGPHQGRVPLRFPQSALATFGAMASIGRMPTGLELQLSGMVRRVTFTVRVLESDHYGVTAEVFQGAQKALPTWTLCHTDDREQHATFTFAHSAFPAAPIRLLFPTHTVVEVTRVAVDAPAVLDADFVPFDYRALPDSPGLTWGIHGDSLSQGANAAIPSATWVNLTALTLRVRPLNWAIGGYGKAEPCMADFLATCTGLDLLSLHIGVNCAGEPAEAFQRRLGDMIGAIRTAHPRLPVVLATPIICLHDWASARRQQDIRHIRHAIVTLHQHLVSRGDDSVFLLHGADLMSDPAGLLIDGLHLSEYGAMCYAQALARAMRPVLDAIREKDPFVLVN